MAIQVQCDRCGEELNQKGAILFSPPFDYQGYDVCDKYHICVKCWNWLIKVTTAKPNKGKKHGPPKDQRKETQDEGVRGNSTGTETT